MVSSRFVTPTNSIILKRLKSLVCKVRLLTMVLFETHNFAWEADLKNEDKDLLTGADV